jgi:MFS transporter, FHS family, L-fucose permease
MVVLIFLIFFVISLITNILGPLIPDIIKSFNLNLTLVAFLPFSFFAAYGVMSIPAGMLVEKYSEKIVILWAFGIEFFAAILFSVYPSYSIALISLFLLGIGMAILQVAINPLLRVSGGEEHFAFNSVLAQLVFGSASFISPFIYSYLVTNISDQTQTKNFLISTLSNLVPSNLPWVSLYWLFAVLILVMLVVIYAAKFPTVERKEDEKAGAWEVHKKLFKQKTVILFFIGIFAYVGTEQGIANWISQFLFVYHNYDPLTVGSNIVSYFWGLLTVGCLLGLVLLKLYDSRKILIGFAIFALFWLTIALWGSTDFFGINLALISFPLAGFSLSVMWSIIFSLALNSLETHHGSFSGILCTAIIGGALVPVIIGWIGDMWGLKTGMLFLYLTLGYILSIGFWAKPIITNETIKLKKETA